MLEGDFAGAAADFPRHHDLNLLRHLLRLVWPQTLAQGIADEQPPVLRPEKLPAPSIRRIAQPGQQADARGQQRTRRRCLAA